MRGSRRGFALVEMLVVSVIGAVVILGIGTMYWHGTRAWSQSQAQAAIQRQGTLIEQEMTRVILPARWTFAGCGDNTAVSVGVQVPAGALPEFPSGGPDGFVCFFMGNVVKMIMECRFQSATSRACLAGTRRNLMAGTPFADQMEAHHFSLNFPWGSFADGDRMVPVQFDIAVRSYDKIVAGPVRFSTHITIRN